MKFLTELSIEGYTDTTSLYRVLGGVRLARQLDDWLKAYLAYTAPLEAPDKFHFWAGVSAVAGALRRRVWIDMGLFQWTPNFYIIFVAPPGIVSKSTTLSVSMKFLREVKDVHFGPDAVTWQALTQALAAAKIEYPINGLMYPMSCITIASSEFGTFLNPHDSAMMSVLTDLWDGKTGAWEKHTKTSGSDKVINPWINMAACTTPGWLEGNFPEHLIGEGFTSRCIFVYAEEKRRLVAYPQKELPDDFKELERGLKHDIQQIGKLGGSFGLTDEAFAFGQQWYEDHYGSIKKEFRTKQLAGYLARKQTMIHKLAMILTASFSDELIIHRQELEKASNIITSLEKDMPKVFSGISAAGDARATLLVLDILRAHGQMAKRELYRQVSSQLGFQEFANAMEGAIFTGWVKLINTTYHYVPDKEPDPGTESPARAAADSSGTGS